MKRDLGLPPPPINSPLRSLLPHSSTLLTVRPKRRTNTLREGGRTGSTQEEGSRVCGRRKNTWPDPSPLQFVPTFHPPPRPSTHPREFSSLVTVPTDSFSARPPPLVKPFLGLERSHVLFFPSSNLRKHTLSQNPTPSLTSVTYLSRPRLNPPRTGSASRIVT